MKTIGLTGNLGAGKSAVARMFQALGAKCIDADIIAREVVMPSKPAWDDIVEEFGLEILNCNGEIDRKKLAKIVFSDKDKLVRLNEITHPRIIDAIKLLVDGHRNEAAEVVIIEAALIVEKGGLGDLVTGLIVVTADENSQIERVVAQRGMTREEVEERIRTQMPTEEKVKHATWVVDNSGSLNKTAAQVGEIWEELAR